MKMSKHVPISVVIPSFNGENRLPDLLNALQVQSFKDFEVIVVVDGSTDGTIFLEERVWDLNLTWIKQPNAGRAGARNKGASMASGKVLLFLDDDTIPEQNVVARHLEYHQRSGNSVLVANLETRITDNEFQKFRHYLSQRWLDQLPLSTTSQIPTDNPFLTAAHFSIGSELFLEIGGFDNTLSDNEDYDMALRLTKKDIPIYFDRATKAVLQDHLDVRSYLVRLREYRTSYEDIVIRNKTPNLKVRYIYYEDLNPVKKWIYKMVCTNSMLRIMERPPTWIRIVPEPLRFRIYDLVITGYSNYFPNLKL